MTRNNLNNLTVTDEHPGELTSPTDAQARDVGIVKRCLAVLRGLVSGDGNAEALDTLETHIDAIEARRQTIADEVEARLAALRSDRDVAFAQARMAEDPAERVRLMLDAVDWIGDEQRRAVREVLSDCPEPDPAPVKVHVTAISHDE